MFHRIILTALMLSLSLSLAWGDEWRMVTDRRNVNDMLSLDGSLWIATAGGLLRFDPPTEQFTTYSLVEGLAGIGIRRMIRDRTGGVWLLFNNRHIQRFEPLRGVTHTVSRLAQESDISVLNDIVWDPRGMFVATDRGVALLTYAPPIDRWVVKSDYMRLGSFPFKQPAQAVEIKGDELWVGTEIGVARGDLTTPDPLTWANYTTLNGLAGDQIRDLIVFGDHLIAATNGGVSSWDGSGWSLMSTDRSISRFYVFNDSLRAVVGGGVATWNGSAWERIPQAGVTSFTIDDGGRLWTGLRSDGTVRGGIATALKEEWTSYIPQGPASNKIEAFCFLPNGDLLMAGGQGGGEYGLSRFDGRHWRNWTRPDYDGAVFHSLHRSIVTDLDDGVWVGTFGGGIARYNPDGTIDMYDHTEATGARLSRSSDVPNWTITPDLAVDRYGNVWVVNYSAQDGNSLICIPRDYIQHPSPDKEWHYFHRSLFNNFPYFECIAIDGRDRIWLASNATATGTATIQGVYVLDWKSSLENRDDDTVYKQLPGLNSQQIADIEWDALGNLIWVGSLDGAYYVDASRSNLTAVSFTQLYPLRDVRVNAISIDPRGNKWLGTIYGVTVVDEDLFTLHRIIGADRPDLLPNPVVRKIAIDPHTGWAYIATDEGTAALFTPYRDYGTQISSVTVEPNPFNPNQGRLYFTGSSLADNASAKIFTPDGRLVRSLMPEQAALGWDGRDARNQRVANGVYLILTYTDDGQTATGKVALLWK